MSQSQVCTNIPVGVHRSCIACGQRLSYISQNGFLASRCQCGHTYMVKPQRPQPIVARRPGGPGLGMVAFGFLAALVVIPLVVLGMSVPDMD